MTFETASKPMGSEYRSRTIRPSVCSELVRAMTSLYAPRPALKAAGPSIWQPASGSHADRPTRTTMVRNRTRVRSATKSFTIISILKLDRNSRRVYWTLVQ